MGARLTERFVEANGITLFIAEAGAGRPLVFFHGLGWDHELWRGAIDTFSPRYRVLAGDTRGHGRSAKPDVPYTVQLYSQDWAAALKALGIEKACIVGFSQGGMTAQLLALEHPELVSALVLASCVCAANPAGREKMEERIRAGQAEGPAAAARAAAKSVFSAAYMSAHPQRMDEFVRWRAAMEQAPLVHATRAGYGFDVAERLKTLRVPTLVIYGEEDTLTPPPAVKRVAGQIPAAALVGIAGSGHMIPVEKPAEFTSAIEAFLARHYAPAG
jgi:3-oxoadipate enol-lactonase